MGLTNKTRAPSEWRHFIFGDDVAHGDDANDEDGLHRDVVRLFHQNVKSRKCG